MTKTVIVTLMSFEQARELTDRVRSNAMSMADDLLKLYEGGAHRSLGYTSWGEYFEAEFSKSGRHGYRLLEAARTERELKLLANDDASLTQGSIKTERMARELSKVAPEARHAVLEAASEDGKPPTESGIRAVLDRVLPPVEDAPKSKRSSKAGRPKKAKITAEQVQAATRARRNQGAPPPLKDSVGRPVPEKLRQLFENDALKEVQKRVQALRKDIAAIAELPIGAHLTAQQVDIDLKNVWEAMKFAQPYAVCPKCMASGKCDTCKGRGWLPKLVYRALPSEFREAVGDEYAAA